MSARIWSIGAAMALLAVTTGCSPVASSIAKSNSYEIPVAIESETGARPAQPNAPQIVPLQAAQLDSLRKTGATTVSVTGTSDGSAGVGQGSVLAEAHGDAISKVDLSQYHLVLKQDASGAWILKSPTADSVASKTLLESIDSARLILSSDGK